jgi:mannosyltransferase OCH1-like enzyme
MPDAKTSSTASHPPSSSRQRIPKVLHLTCVGDESKRPDNCIRTWVEHNPEWTVKLWGNDDLRDSEWVNARHIKAMWDKELNGVADLMRWEILYNEGGVVVDADSVCVRPLDDWLLEADAMACWENEIARPRLIACGMVGSFAQNPFFGQIIQDLRDQESVVHDMAWKTVGPLCLTTAYVKYRYTGLTIWPSHFFLPNHFTGVNYEGGGIVYAKQEWASTNRAYDSLHLKQVA